MTRPVQISAKALLHAQRLGQDMARSEILIRPRICDARQYENYLRFRNAHRAYWEQSDCWEHLWQAKLFAIAEREAARLGLPEHSSINSWDLWYNQIVHPLKSALWETWEGIFQLERRYHDALFSQGTASSAQIASILRSGKTVTALRPAPVQSRRRSLLSFLPFFTLGASRPA